MTKQARNLLFDPEDIVGYKIQPYDSSVLPYTPLAQFFVINALSSYKNATNSNCRKLRSFLIEMDTGSLQQQERYIEGKKELPFTTKTYSGGKSIHYIVTLEQPVSEPQYREYWKTLRKVLRDSKGAVDTSNSNPARLSRVPGAVRHDGGLEQTLIETHTRVPNDAWEKWLKTHPSNYLLFMEQDQEVMYQKDTNKNWVLDLIQNPDRIVEGNRHRTLVAAALSGAPEELLLELADKLGKSEREISRIIKWANAFKGE